MSKAKRKRESTIDKEEEVEEAVDEAPTIISSRAAALSAFTGTGADLASSLQTSSLDALRTSLTNIRTLTSRNSHDEKISPSDRRIQLAVEFCRAGGIGQSGFGQSSTRGLLNAWDFIDTQEQTTLVPIPIFILSNLISLLGSHQPTHDLVDEIIETIMPASSSSANGDATLFRSAQENLYWNRLQTYLSLSGGRHDIQSKGKPVQNRGSQEVVTMATLRLLLEMTTFAGGKYARSIFDSMNWTMKTLPRLLSMRRRTNHKKGAKIIPKPKNAVTLDRPDIRTLWILFLLSFLCSSTGVNQPISLQISILSLGKDFLPAILKGLSNDQPQIVVHILMALHAGLISDEAAQKLPRSKVVGFFSEWACKELLALYEREADLVSVAGTGEKHSIADVVHHFMLALCTHPGRGICYVDQGWYGKQQGHSHNDEDDDGMPKEEVEGSATAVFNKILLGLLKSLSPTRSSKQAELTLRILSASQELLSPYLQASTGSLSSASIEPRSMSIAWLSTAAFMGRVLGTPLPEASKWRAMPPSYDRCLHSLFPASLNRAILLRGIQHKDRLTRHSALVLLSRLLDRLHRFVVLCQQMSDTHDDHITQYSQKNEVEEAKSTDKEEAILRGEYGSGSQHQKPWLKLCNAIIDEARQRMPDLTAILSSTEMDLRQKREEETVITRPTRSPMIAEVALRTARLHCEIFEEATTADLGKLLSNASLSSLHGNDTLAEVDSNQRLSLLCRLHAIQLLTLYAQRNAGGVDLFVRQSGKDTTAFQHLLRLATSPSPDQVREASRDLIKEAMLGTILFEHDIQEWVVWQYALDDSSESFLNFFEECVQRCLKTPYRYIEMARAALPDSQEQNILCASPIFFVMTEQYTIRLQNGLLENDEAKVAVWDFCERYLPALLAVIGEDRSRPLVQVLHSNTMEAFSANDQRSASGEERKISDKSRSIIATAYQRIQRRISLLTAKALNHDLSPDGLLQHAVHSSLEPLLDSRNSKLLFPTDLIWRAIGGIAPKGAIVDWNRLLYSFVETRMMLFHARNLLAHDKQSTEVTKDLLELTLANGRIDTEELVSLLQRALDDQVKSAGQSRFGPLLLQAASEAPLDLDNVEERLLLRDNSEAGQLYEEGKKQGWSLSSITEALIKLHPILDDSLQDDILQNELSLSLFFQATSGFGPRVRVLDKKIILSRLGELIQECKDSALVRNALLMSKSLNADMMTGIQEMGSDIPARVTEKAMASLLNRSDLSELDAVVSSVLIADQTLCHSFLNALLGRDDVADLVRLLPLSLVQATKAIVHHDGADGQKIFRPVTRKCIGWIYSAPQSVAVPLAQACIRLCTLSGMNTEQLLVYLQAVVPTRPRDFFKPSIILLGKELLHGDSEACLTSTFLNLVVDNALLWLVRRFAEDHEESIETVQGLEAFLSLLNDCMAAKSLMKVHLVEPVIRAAVANRLGSKLHLQLMRRLVRMTDLKTSFLEQLLADVLESKAITADERLCMEAVSLVYDVTRGADNLCTADMITSMVKHYKGSLSKTDRKIMKILHLHESKYGVSALSYLQHWEATPKQAVGEIDLGLLSRLDPTRVHETCLKFPRSRGFEDLVASGYDQDNDEASVQSAVYDPLLILAATGALLTRDETMSGLHWLELIRTNALGVVVCCLSSRWPSTRSTAMSILAKVYSGIATADFQEKDHLLMVLDFARNSYKPEDIRDVAHPASLPLTTTLFAAHSLRSLGIPSLYLYPLISRFMLQRPTPDPTDVPLLYNFLYSTSAQSTTAKAEKIFILRYILGCIKYGGSAEWRIMKRRHVWDSICSLYAADGIEGNIKRIIEDIFVAVTKKSDLAFRVVVRHSWLNYISQVYSLETEVNQAKSRHFWVKCLANMLESIDLDRMQPSAGGSMILSQFGSVLNRMQSISEDGEEQAVALTDYNHQLRATRALVDRQVKIDLEPVLSSLSLLGKGWSRTFFLRDRLPSDDMSGGEENLKIHRECKGHVRQIRASLSRDGGIFIAS